jgi:hypothetical protein
LIQNTYKVAGKDVEDIKETIKKEVFIMSDQNPKEKPKYESPVLVPLGEIAKGSGVCAAGTAALNTTTGNCFPGATVAAVFCSAGGADAASCVAGGTDAGCSAGGADVAPVNCTAGITATTACTMGTSATGACTQGVAALTACTAGNTTLPACTAGTVATGACTAGGAKV